MRLKFLRTTAAGKKIYHKSEVHEVKDQHAAEVYVAHGYAQEVDSAGKLIVDSKPGETLKRSYPVKHQEVDSAGKLIVDSKQTETPKPASSAEVKNKI